MLGEARRARLRRVGGPSAPPGAAASSWAAGSGRGRAERIQAVFAALMAFLLLGSVVALAFIGTGGLPDSGRRPPGGPLLAEGRAPAVIAAPQPVSTSPAGGGAGPWGAAVGPGSTSPPAVVSGDGTGVPAAGPATAGGLVDGGGGNGTGGGGAGGGEGSGGGEQIDQGSDAGGGIGVDGGGGDEGAGTEPQGGNAKDKPPKVKGGPKDKAVTSKDDDQEVEGDDGHDEKNGKTSHEPKPKPPKAAAAAGHSNGHGVGHDSAPGKGHDKHH